MPPLKKRRGLAGSIVSTAVNAALIGTAVGLTVYRLWRDRGKEARIEGAEHQVSQLPDPATQPPPPPYEETDWKPLAQPAAIQVASRSPATPRSATRKRRPAPVVAKRPIAYQSTRRSRHTPVTSPAPIQPEFDFGHDDAEDDRIQSVVEDKMDWIGDKLSMLIEQGKRALNTEVVVMSDAKEDEVDDGSGAWEEEEDEDDRLGRQQGRSGSRPSSRAGSIHSGSIKRGKQPRNMAPPLSSGAGLGLYGVNASSTSSLAAAPRRAGNAGGYPTYAPSAPSTSTTYASASPSFAPSSLPRTFLSASPGRAHVRGLSYESALPASFTAGQEDPAEWESPAVRESMERARARLLARRAGA
ncbi:hypothetical protein HYPSUDRAFT_62330 [Hypholoma sublateritium FD-334 SS-4]|uniref:Uncharacterized protein n=1 Tax=Hypholoma sublateritium (strain FD-334 SS-4) TaxID=945553 RepID=A0A0D2PAJ8_HYPSF|nr:hypothetical protein HYPSUDRAFT_62330 [Hypholoma sublateritium FD-334 SS-4]